MKLIYFFFLVEMAFILAVGTVKDSVITLPRPLSTIAKHWSEPLMLRELSSKMHLC